MSTVEQGPIRDTQFPVIHPKYFTNEFQPALYALFVEGGEDGIPAQDAKQLYNVPEFALTTRKNNFKRDLKHLREILSTHYDHEILNKTSQTRGMDGQEAHYVLQRIKKP